MSVNYKEDGDGVYWVEGDQRGESQKNLHHAMKDYEATLRGGKASNASDQQRVHTGDDGGTGAASGGLIADNDGSAGEGQEADGSGNA